MTSKYFVFLAVLIVTSNFFAQNNQQLSVGLESNSQYYVDDDVTGDFTEEDNFRSNNYFKVDYRFNDFDFGVQLESYAPQSLLNYSPAYDSELNLGTFYAKYTKKKFDITVGHFYEQFGSGLLLRTWEDRQLGVNNALRGARINFRPTEKLSITAIYGNERVGFDVTDGTVFGLNTNFDISKENNSLIIGFGYVGRQDDVVDKTTNLDALTHMVSGRINYAKNNIYANIETVLKSKDALAEQGIVSEDKLFYGNALLIELGYSKKGLGISTTLRRLENMNLYAERDAAGNDFNELLVNYLPSLTKQHDYSLANIYVYQAQSNLDITNNQQAGEIGFQTDLFYKIKKETALGGKYGTKIALNYSDWHGLKAKYNQEFKRAEIEFLDFGKIYYRDASIEVRKKISKKTNTIFTYINNYYNKDVIEGGGGIVKSNTLVGEITQKFANKKSLRAEAQHLWTEDDRKNWVAGLAEFNFNTKLAIFATDMYNYGNDVKEDQNHYFTIGGSYTNNKSRFGLSYGRQRGGLICVGGVCRFVPAATGFTFSVNTSF